MLSFESLCAQEGQLDKENFGISKLITSLYTEGVLAIIALLEFGRATWVPVPAKPFFPRLGCFCRHCVLAPFMIHEAFPYLTETASDSHPCCVVSVTYDRPSYFHGGNTGSNPVGDAHLINQLQIPSRILYVR
jgi:hypothetical protein